jgi:hypothetical protein
MVQKARDIFVFLFAQFKDSLYQNTVFGDFIEFFIFLTKKGKGTFLQWGGGTKEDTYISHF